MKNTIPFVSFPDVRKRNRRRQERKERSDWSRQGAAVCVSRKTMTPPHSRRAGIKGPRPESPVGRGGRTAYRTAGMEGKAIAGRQRTLKTAIPTHQRNVRDLIRRGSDKKMTQPLCPVGRPIGRAPWREGYSRPTAEERGHASKARPPKYGNKYYDNALWRLMLAFIIIFIHIFGGSVALMRLWRRGMR